MSEIPEDVWEAAKATVRRFPYDWVDPLHTKAAVIANAILAERKRCADVARHLNGWGYPPAPALAEHIAHIIESAQ